MKHEPSRAAPVEARLATALTTAAAAATIDAEVTDHRSRPWASATYIGARHRIVLVAPRSPALGAWVAALPDAELAMRGHIVASIAVDRIEDDGASVTVTLDALTIEES